uniref:Uncharacterized protein n=1 Tax=Leersia perrieri TaxID=77586 RepID=A0A0D9X7C9_9ORYZ
MVRRGSDGGERGRRSVAVATAAGGDGSRRSGGLPPDLWQQCLATRAGGVTWHRAGVRVATAMTMAPGGGRRRLAAEGAAATASVSAGRLRPAYNNG